MMRLTTAALVLATLFSIPAQDAVAQAISQQDTRPLPGLPQKFAEEPQGFGLPSAAGAGTAPKAALSGRSGFVLRDVQFDGATVFAKDELKEVLGAFVGRSVTIEDLEVMRQALTRFYIDAGYVNSGALVPKQKIDDGVLVFRIVEGRLIDILPRGDDIGSEFGPGGQLAPDYIVDRIGISPDQPLNVEELREQFGILLADPMVDRLRGQLKPGAKLGEAVLDLDVDIRDPISAWASVNNHNSVSNGALGVDAGFSLYNLTGRGDVSQFQGTVTEGRFEGFGRISAPFFAGAITPFVEARYADSEVVESPFDRLDITNKYLRLTAGLEHRMLNTTTQHFDLTLSFDRTTSETRLLDAPFPPTGLNDDIVTAYALRFSQEWVHRGADEVLALRSTFSLGLDVFDATKGDPGAGDGDYFSWLGQAQYIRRINERVSALARIQAQFAGNALPSYEQIGLGGINTVRGYRSNAIARDNGLAITLEAPVKIADLPIPGLSGPGEPAPLEMTPFIDYAAGWNDGERFGSRTDLLGVGAGVNWRPTRNLSLDLVYGLPVIKDSAIARGSDLTDDAVYFTVTLFTN